MKKFLHTRALPLLLCFTLTLGVVSYETPKAEAVVSDAVMLSALAFAFSTAVGVVWSMNSENNETLASMGTKLLREFCETNDAYDALCAAAGDAAIVAGSPLRIAMPKALVEKLSDFVNWLTTDKGMAQGGDAVQVVKASASFVATQASYSSYGPADMLKISLLNSDNIHDWQNLIYSLGVNSYALAYFISEANLGCLYFDADGVFRLGYFENPYGAVNASFLGVYNLSDLNFQYSVPFYFRPVSSSSSIYRILYDKSCDAFCSNFLLSDFLAFDHSVDWTYQAQYSYYLMANAYLKQATGSTWFSSSTRYRLGDTYTSGDSYAEGDSSFLEGKYYVASGYTISADDDSISGYLPQAPSLPETADMGTTYNYVINTNVTTSNDDDDVYEAVLDALLASNFSATGTLEEKDDTQAGTGEDAGTDTGAGTESGTVVDAESKGFLAYIPQIFEQIKSIPSTIAEKIGELFAPDEALITEITDTFKAKFGFITTLKQLGDDLLSMTPETDPPVIWIHLEDAESEYGYSYGGMVKALDLTWYQKYKADVDRIISGFLWLGFLWLLFKRAASIIRGGEMLTEYSNDLTRTYRESSSRENEAKFQNWLWRD